MTKNFVYEIAALKEVIANLEKQIDLQDQIIKNQQITIQTLEEYLLKFKKLMDDTFKDSQGDNL